MFQLFEFKARSNRNGKLEQKLSQLDARFVGEDHQKDTYFNVSIWTFKTVPLTEKRMQEEKYIS